MVRRRANADSLPRRVPNPPSSHDKAPQCQCRNPKYPTPSITSDCRPPPSAAYVIGVFLARDVALVGGYFVYKYATAPHPVRIPPSPPTTLLIPWDPHPRLTDTHPPSVWVDATGLLNKHARIRR